MKEARATAKLVKSTADHFDKEKMGQNRLAVCKSTDQKTFTTRTLMYHFLQLSFQRLDQLSQFLDKQTDN